MSDTSPLDTLLFTCIALILIIGAFCAGAALIQIDHTRTDINNLQESVDTLNNQASPIPSCFEDEIIIGGGEFEDSYWTYYRCIPADNFRP